MTDHQQCTSSAHRKQKGLAPRSQTPCPRSPPISSSGLRECSSSSERCSSADIRFAILLASPYTNIQSQTLPCILEPSGTTKSSSKSLQQRVQIAIYTSSRGIIVDSLGWLGLKCCIAMRASLGLVFEANTTCSGYTHEYTYRVKRSSLPLDRSSLQIHVPRQKYILHMHTVLYWITYILYICYPLRYALDYTQSI